jgi:hypothetical protein
MLKGSRIMSKSIRLVQLILGLLLSTNGFADDARFIDSNIQSLLAESRYAPRWQLYHPADATAYPERWIRPIANIEFRDNSALGRISKLRNLSLLTLVESQQARLFFGVNDDGLVGLHLIKIRGRDDERHLSLARVPWLKKKQ